MKLLEAIKLRKSIRAFKPDPVPKEVLTELLDVARWSPSSANTQPWEFFVLAGEVSKGSWVIAPLPFPFLVFPQYRLYTDRDNGFSLRIHPAQLGWDYEPGVFLLWGDSAHQSHRPRIAAIRPDTAFPFGECHRFPCLHLIERIAEGG